MFTNLAEVRDGDSGNYGCLVQRVFNCCSWLVGGLAILFDPSECAWWEIPFVN